MSGFIVMLTIASLAGLGLLTFESSIELMLPDEENIHQTIGFLRNSSLSDKIVISLSLDSPDGEKSELFRAADQLEASLVPPLFTRTVSGASGTEIMNEVLFSHYFPYIATEEDLVSIEAMITSEYVSGRMQDIYRQLLRPQSIFTASMYYADPLGINLLLLDKFKRQTASMGYKVNVENGHFISPDGRHTMIIAHTSVPITDSAGSGKLVEALREKLGELPSHVSADIVSGHLHTVSNERVIKQDIRLTIGIAAAAFLLLFFILFRDIKAVLVFLIPFASVILSMNLSSLIMGSLSYWVAGLGTVIAGISVDYGIHIFVSVRNSGNDAKVISNVAKPVSLGAVTTAGIFAAFFFSDIRGYHQLALFSIICISLSLAFALLVLPHYLSKGQWFFVHSSNKGTDGVFSHVPARPVVFLWAGILVACLVLSFQVNFDSDVIKLDGSEKEVLRAEENFQQTWGGQDNRGILVVSATSYEGALEKNDAVFQEAKKRIGADNITSFSELWPSHKARRENALRWNGFWKKGKEAALKKLIREESLKYQLRDSAFSPFFKSLYVQMPRGDEHNGEFLSTLKERFVQEEQERYSVLSFFPDQKDYVDALSDIRGMYPGTFIVSRKALSGSISEALSAEVKLFAMLATIFIVLLTFLFLKDFRKSLLALVPVITNVLLLLGVMSLCNLSLNIANMIAGIVAMGLCIDYGIFMTYGHEHEFRRNAVLSVSISALTTLIGAGVLVFAQHPALFSIGITLVTGVLAGYVSSVVVIPSLEKLLSPSTVSK